MNNKTQKPRKLGLRSVYVKFSLIFLAIWWVFNSATFVMIMQVLADGQTDEIRRMAGIIFINNAVLGTIVILVALRSIVKPIRKLSSAARDVAKGKFDVTVDIQNQDEIGRLAADFNTMAREIESLDKMRREFVESVSHEFRTPITSIRGFAQLVGENPEDAETIRECSETIVRESERLIDLSSNLLRLSELDSKTIHEESEFCLDEQIRQVILFLAPHWETKNIEFDLELPEVSYTGDEDLLRQLWLNLIHNAMKFSPDGGTIKVSIVNTSDGIHVSIADNGIGIPKEDIPHIFDRFFKGDQSSNGNGLGLSIIQRIVQFVGGSITVESEVNKGTTFVVDLPV